LIPDCQERAEAWAVLYTMPEDCVENLRGHAYNPATSKEVNSQ
jgi:hypothetical protein